MKVAAAGSGSSVGRLAGPFSCESKMLASKTRMLPVTTIFWRLRGPPAGVSYTGTALSSGGLYWLHWVRSSSGTSTR